MKQKQLLRKSKAAKAMNLSLPTFIYRNYPPAQIIDGTPFYDVGELSITIYEDKRKFNKGRKPKI